MPMRVITRPAAMAGTVLPHRSGIACSPVLATRRLRAGFATTPGSSSTPGLLGQVALGAVPANGKRPGNLAGWIPDQAKMQVHIQLMAVLRSEEHTSELQSLMRISYAVF